MTAKVWLDEDGHRILDSSGYQYICTECPCGGCPAQVDVSITGVVRCSSNGNNAKVIAGTLNGDYTLDFLGIEQLPGQEAKCTYFLEDFATFTIEAYDDFEECQTNGNVINTVDETVSLFVKTSEATGKIYGVDIGRKGAFISPSLVLFGSNAYFRYEDFTEAVEKFLGDVIPNRTDPCCIVGNEDSYFSGGQAVVTVA